MNCCNSFLIQSGTDGHGLFKMILAKNITRSYLWTPFCLCLQQRFVSFNFQWEKLWNLIRDYNGYCQYRKILLWFISDLSDDHFWNWYIELKYSEVNLCKCCGVHIPGYHGNHNQLHHRSLEANWGRHQWVPESTVEGPTNHSPDTCAAYYCISHLCKCWKQKNVKSLVKKAY